MGPKLNRKNVRKKKRIIGQNGACLPSILSTAVNYKAFKLVFGSQKLSEYLKMKKAKSTPLKKFI